MVWEKQRHPVLAARPIAWHEITALSLHNLMPRTRQNRCRLTEGRVLHAAPGRSFEWITSKLGCVRRRSLGMVFPPFKISKVSWVPCSWNISSLMLGHGSTAFVQRSLPAGRAKRRKPSYRILSRCQRSAPVFSQEMESAAAATSFCFQRQSNFSVRALCAARVQQQLSCAPARAWRSLSFSPARKLLKQFSAGSR